MMKQNKCSLFEFAEGMVCSTNSIYKNTAVCREHLVEFMNENDWFGIDYSIKKDLPVINESDCEKLINPLKLWLSAYKKPGYIKIELMLQYFEGTFPKTCRLYSNFIKKRKIENEDYAWKLLDYLFSEITKEITEYEDIELDALIKQMYANATIVVTNTFSEFLQTIKANGKSTTKWVYTFESHERYDIPSGAYPMEDYAVLTYCVFNEQMWAKSNLVEKAVKSQIFAELWVFVALHFICALRNTDLKRLPAPTLPYDKDTVFDMILNKRFEKQEARALSEELCVRLAFKPMKPSKTLAYSNVPDLKLFVSESLKEPFGIIMAIMLAHHAESGVSGTLFDSSKKFYWRLPQLRKFFGTDFVERLEKRRFSSIRTNRSYLQGLDSVASI
ncbi:MAG: hypothetical protein EOM23_02825, partial [Candidatus Moranbacteria bacterium]|nr:hypothetical protein [Candidatus Moranbacteria bacterium]